MLDALRDTTALALAATAEVLHTLAELVAPETHGSPADHLRTLYAVPAAPAPDRAWLERTYPMVPPRYTDPAL